MTYKAKLAFPISAGGVVYRLQENTPEILICGRHQAGGWLWALPKGTPEAGESIPNTALREVLEETGLEVNLSKRIDSVNYWFLRNADQVRCYKTVYFYLMTTVGGSIENHDSEFDVVEWIDAITSLTKLTHEAEKSIVEKSIRIIRDD